MWWWLVMALLDFRGGGETDGFVCGCCVARHVVCEVARLVCGVWLSWTIFSGSVSLAVRLCCSSILSRDSRHHHHRRRRRSCKSFIITMLVCSLTDVHPSVSL